jgi:hypothetical protein
LRRRVFHRRDCANGLRSGSWHRIDYGNCASVCAQNAIFALDELPADKAEFAEKSKAYFNKYLSSAGKPALLSIADAIISESPEPQSTVLLRRRQWTLLRAPALLPVPHRTKWAMEPRPLPPRLTERLPLPA